MQLPLRLVCASLVLSSLSGCRGSDDPDELLGADDAAVETPEPEDAAQGAPRDAGLPAAAEPDAGRASESEDCDGGKIVGEFSDCVRMGETDASVAAPDADVPAADAGEPIVDAGEPPEPICDDAPYACSNELMRPLAAGASCSFAWTGAFEATFNVCEDCGTERTTFEAGLVFRDCGGCEQRYATSGETGMAILSNGACTTVRYRTPNGLEQTSVEGQACVDVYASTQSTLYDSLQQGTAYRDEQLAHVCRCDANARTCVSCEGGGCEDASGTP